MPTTKAPSVLLLHSLRATVQESSSLSRRTGLRALSSTANNGEQTQVEKPPQAFTFQNPNPETVYNPRLERRVLKAGAPPVGSRRRRMALARSPKVPFEQLPYQCFQEARQILIADRQEKLKQIETERTRIARTQEADASTLRGGEAFRKKRLESLHKELEHLKVLADINDPQIKRRFEDGKGDMRKPIYRFLADRKWREYRRKVVIQRVTQMKVVPDVVPHCTPIIDIRMAFGARPVQPGDFVDSLISEQACRLHIQSFEGADKLVSIAVVDPDVPNLETDRFDTKCHFLATNIPLTNVTPAIHLAKLSEKSQVLVPWFPPTAQKGSPYHRLSIIVFQQKDNIPVDMEVARKRITGTAKDQGKDSFSTRAFMTRHLLHPIGATLFRTKWDDNTAEVMARAGIDGANVELKRVKVEPLPYKRRNPSTFR